MKYRQETLVTWHCHQSRSNSSSFAWQRDLPPQAASRLLSFVLPRIATHDIFFTYRLKSLLEARQFLFSTRGLVAEHTLGLNRQAAAKSQAPGIESYPKSPALSFCYIAHLRVSCSGFLCHPEFHDCYGIHFPSPILAHSCLRRIPTPIVRAGWRHARNIGLRVSL